MEKDVAAAISELRHARLQMQAMTTVLSAQVAVHQIALAKMAQQSGTLLDGQPFEAWLQKNILEALNLILLGCPDEQLAAEIRDHIDRAVKNTGQGGSS